MTLIELTGQRFGRLSVICRDGTRSFPSGQRKPTWLCKCDCGNEKVVVGQCLRRGEVVSCGCYNAEKSTAIADAGMEGSRFGRWSVGPRAGVTDHGLVMFACECDCGTTRLVSGSVLRRGLSGSCGCTAVEAATIAKAKSVVKYDQAHGRVHGLYGPAKNRRCVDCDSAAHEWSYDGGDPREIHELVHGKYLLAYSLTPSYYSPRCHTCHRRYDIAARRKKAVA